MPYVVKKFMVYDGESFHRGAIWTPKGFHNDREIIRHFVTEVADEVAADEAGLPVEAPLDLAPVVDEVPIVAEVAKVTPPRRRGRHARNT
jgi:hypothetical protein